jgi:hypothetical protein
MVWPEGGTPGRKLGTRNKRTTEIINRLVSNGFNDPLLVLGEIVTNSDDPHLRAQAANMLAPYLHGKHGIIPAPIYIEAKVDLPHANPTKLDQVRENIIYLTNLKLSAQIDTATAGNLILDQRHLHDSILEEMKLLYSQGGSADVQIHISGGLTPLPGTDIIMPQINGVIDAVAVPEASASGATTPIDSVAVANQASTPDANADASSINSTNSICPVVRQNAPPNPK